MSLTIEVIDRGGSVVIFVEGSDSTPETLDQIDALYKAIMSGQGQKATMVSSNKLAANFRTED